MPEEEKNFLKLPKLDFTLWRAARLKEAAEKKAKILKNAQPGQEIAGEGIFLGQCQPKDLGKIFNIFAAPEDLPDASGNRAVFKYVDAVKRVSELKGWNGFDGTNYATDKEFHQVLKDGSYTGGWIIPPKDILKENLYPNKDKGELKDTFTTAARWEGSDFPGWYWSSTEDRDYPSGVWVVRFSDGDVGWIHKDGLRLSCRPVRLVEASSPAPG